MKVLLAVSASAGIYALAFPPFALAGFSWVALVPLVLVLRHAPPAVAGVWSAVWAALATAAVIPWLVPTLTGHFERSLMESLGLYALICLLSAAPFYAMTLGAWAFARPYVPGALAPVLFAAAWVAGEYARVHLGLRSPWLRLGDAQHGAEHVRQIADLTGVYGVSGLIALGNAALAELAVAALARVRGTRAGADALAHAACAAGAFVLALCIALVYGYARTHRDADSPASGLEIAVVHGSQPAKIRWRRATAGRVLRHYGEPTRDLVFAAGSPPDLIIWPENALQTEVDEPVSALVLRAWARETPLLLGAPRHDGALVYNSAFLLRQDGGTEYYDKRRLLPFSESHPLGRVGALPAQGDLDVAEYAPGARPGLFQLRDARLGVLVCLEALYPELARELALGGATVLVNVSNEGWYRGSGAAEQQLAQSVFRAIETRLPLVRATAGGVSAFVAPDGAVVARVADGARTLVAPLPPPWPGPSLYTRLGDVFAQACAAVCALALAYAAVRRRQRAVPALRAPTDEGG